MKLLENVVFYIPPNNNISKDASSDALQKMMQDIFSNKREDLIAFAELFKLINQYERSLQIRKAIVFYDETNFGYYINTISSANDLAQAMHDIGN